MSKSKYPRQNTGYFGLDSTTFLWAIIGAVLLAGGVFLFGMYYGYQQGYQAAKESLSDETGDPRKVAKSETNETSPPPPKKESPESGEPQPAITQDQLSGTEEEQPPSFEQKSTNSSRRNTENPPSSYAGSTASSSTSDQSGSESKEATSSSGQESHPDALNVTEVDTTGQETPSGPSDSASDNERSATEETAAGGPSSSADTSGSNSAESDRPNAIQAEGPIYTIQAVSFLKKERAKREVRELKSQGYDAAITEKMINGRKWYRVRVGSYSDRTEADDAAQKMVKDGIIDDYWISKVEK